LHIPICSISGGEPTLAADLPYIIEEAARVFPIEVILFSNFYGDTHTIQPAIESALKNNAHIVCSFDGFGQVGDYLRGGSNVPNVILKHIEMTTKMKALMNSSSILEIHTVVCNQNVSHMGAILDMSKVYGWVQTIAPVNHFYYLKNNGNLPGLTCTPQLKNVLNLATMANNLKQMPSFTKGILDYANGTHKKYCPYDERSPINKFKIFLQADGNISLCDRTPLGNINQTTLEEIFKSKDYNDYLQRIKTCPGCWLSCFTEPALAMKPTNYLEVFRRL